MFSHGAGALSQNGRRTRRDGNLVPITDNYTNTYDIAGSTNISLQLLDPQFCEDMHPSRLGMGNAARNPERTLTYKQVMESAEWDDVKRIHDEVERIIRAPYDVSLKVSFVDHLWSIPIQSTNLLVPERRGFLTIEQPFQVNWYLALMVIVFIRGFAIFSIRFLWNLWSFGRAAIRAKSMDLQPSSQTALRGQITRERFYPISVRHV